MVGKSRKKRESPNEDADTKQSALLGFRRVYVWDESQTEGAPLPELDKVTGEAGVYLDRLRDYVTRRVSRLSTTRASHPLWAWLSAPPFAFCRVRRERGRTSPLWFTRLAHLMLEARRTPHGYNQDRTRNGSRSRGLS